MVYEFFFRKPFSKNVHLTPTSSALSFTQHCKIFFKAFSRMQPNTEKKIIFPEIIFIRKHFTMENILQRNKRSLIFLCKQSFGCPLIIDADDFYHTL